MLTFGLLGKPGKKKKRPVSKNKPKPQAGNQPQQAQSKSIRSKKQPILHEVTSGRLYVGNLDYGANEAELEELFKGVGTVVTAEVVTNQRTQQSKGFAFVEMGNIDEAKRAVEILHDQDFMGRKLLVSGAKSEGPRDGADDDDSGSSSDTSTETDAGEEEAA
ncbi:MAG: hypothetical protein HKN23_10750 [Verrucomicrobiales bacterium]|nr:hypothetical protein [Verrucomicrobiales bacterium]